MIGNIDILNCEWWEMTRKRSDLLQNLWQWASPHLTAGIQHTAADKERKTIQSKKQAQHMEDQIITILEVGNEGNDGNEGNEGNDGNVGEQKVKSEERSRKPTVSKTSPVIIVSLT